MKSLASLRRCSQHGHCQTMCRVSSSAWPQKTHVGVSSAANPAFDMRCLVWMLPMRRLRNTARCRGDVKRSDFFCLRSAVVPTMSIPCGDVATPSRSFLVLLVALHIWSLCICLTMCAACCTGVCNKWIWKPSVLCRIKGDIHENRSSLSTDLKVTMRASGRPMLVYSTCFEN